MAPKKFSQEFKDEAVRAVVESSRTIADVAREFNVGPETLRNWVKKYQEANPVEDKPLTISERARLEQLERENQELRLEREFLGKATAFFAKKYR